jgi:hypothetical protein
MIRRVLERELESYIAEHPSATSLGLYDTDDPARGLAALLAATRAVGGIPHPDEPDDPLPNWCTAVMRDGVPVFHLDMKDCGDYAGRVARILLGSVAAAGVGGRLEPYRWPDPGYQYDHRAYVFDGERIDLDSRGLLPSFPDGFPAPEGGVPVLAQRLPDGGELIAWRSDGGPFAAYPARLRELGYDLGPASAGTYTEALGMARLALWRDGAGGTLSLYREPRIPGHPVANWYAGVVWHPTADRPQETVDGPPDGWPGPREFDGVAAYRLAASLAPDGHAEGVAMLLAYAEANAVLEPAARGVGRGRNALGPLVASVGPLLRTLTARQRAVVRDCATLLTRNWAEHGTTYRVEPPVVATDDDGLRYEPTVRSRFLTVLDPQSVDIVETALSVLEPVRFLQDVLRHLRTGRPPAASLLDGLFTDLDPDRAAEATGACWQIARR